MQFPSEEKTKKFVSPRKISPFDCTRESEIRQAHIDSEIYGIGIKSKVIEMRNNKTTQLQTPLQIKKN